VVVLADSRKFERVSPAYVFGLDEVGTIVTDDGIPEAVRATLEERGIPRARGTVEDGSAATERRNMSAAT